MDKLESLTNAMIEYYAGDPKRIQHFIKVHAFSKMIAQGENIDRKVAFILESAALVHDIGIKPSEEKYGVSDGKHQELEGPAAAKNMLEGLGYESAVTERVCYLVGHHHTYTNIDAVDYQILVEADFLVNIYEDRLSTEAAYSALSKIFKTRTGSHLCKTMFGLK